MANFLEINTAVRPVGATEIHNGRNFGTNDKLEELRKQAKAASQPGNSAENNLEPLKQIVGDMSELDIPREHIIMPYPEWAQRFPAATADDIKKMAASIYRYGLLHRITVWEKDEGKYMILGGSTRTAAFDYLFEVTGDGKYKTIPCKVYQRNQIDEIDAHRIFLISNTDQRLMSLRTVTGAYYDLISLEKQKSFYGSGIYSRDAAAKQANVSPTTFTRYLSIGQKLYPPLFDEANEGHITVKVAYYLSRMPEDMQKSIYEEGLYKNISTSIAKRLQSEAKSMDDIRYILQETKSAIKYYKYAIESKVAKPKDKDVIPIFIDRNNRQEIIEQLAALIRSSNLDENVKNDILATIA